MISYFGIQQFNALFTPYINSSTTGLFEILIAMLVFCSVLVVRTAVLEYTNASPFPKWNRRLGQFGLYLHGMLATFVFFDGYKCIYDLTVGQAPQVFLCLFMISVLAIKGPNLFRAYHLLITNKKMSNDFQKGFFI